jgi:hypothetical protein
MARLTSGPGYFVPLAIARRMEDIIGKDYHQPMTSARARAAWMLAAALVIVAAYVADPRRRPENSRMEVPAAAPPPHVAALASTPDRLIRAFGAPDYDQATVGDDSVTIRRVTYAVEYVQVVYRTERSTSDPAANLPWKLIGFRDPASNAPLDPKEALLRLDARKR